MYRRSNKAASDVDKYTAKLKCGKVYTGQLRMVKKLVTLHAKFCEDCAAEQAEGIEYHQFERTHKRGFVDSSYMTRAMERANDNAVIAACPDDEASINKFMDLVAEDCLKHAHLYRDQVSKVARVGALRAAFDQKKQHV